MTYHHLFAATLAISSLYPALLSAETRNVNDTSELRAAIDAANPGDRIVLADGTYRLDSKVNIRRAGTAADPIVMEAVNRHGAIIEVNTVEGINWNAAYWHIEGLHFKGVCSQDKDCEHALHIVESSDFGVIRHNVFEDFNAQIKGNGQLVNGAYQYPDDVLIEGNEFFDNAARQTSNPVTKIDVVGGRRWIIRANFIHDFAKGEGNSISYAAFLKGNSRDGLFERNLVACEALHTGQIRLGLSFGGGGTGPDTICEDGTCTPEHQNGIMRNNIIANCPADVAIYINASTNTLIEHNTIYNTSGIDVRFEDSSATLRDNLIAGRIRERDGGTITLDERNLQQLSEADFTTMFLNPGALDFSLADGSRFVDQATGSQLADDFCGAMRNDPRDIGAIEYTTASPCDTSLMPPTVGNMMMPGEDMGTPPADMGQPTQDMGGNMPSDMGSNPVDMGNTPAGMDDMADSTLDQGGTPGSDMNPGMMADMTESPIESPQPVDDEGCAQAAGSSPTGTPALLGLLGLLGLRRRRA